MRTAFLCLWLSVGSMFAEPTNAARQIDATTFEIGLVRIDSKLRRLIIPATVNMIEGPVEYVLVSAIGKLHESIFKTAAEPTEIHAAALLLLKTPPSTNSPPGVTVSVESPGREKLPVEQVIENTLPSKKLSEGPWRYTGSRIVDSTFVAQRDGSIISIIADREALIENGRVSAEDDENWRPRKSALPPVGAPISLIISFERQDTARHD